MTAFVRKKAWSDAVETTPYTFLGDKNDIHIGKGFSVSRPPLSFFDVTGSEIIFCDNVMVSSGVYIHTHSHCFENKEWRDMPIIISQSPTIIGNYVFIGVNAQIMHTCKEIGDYSVIAAGSIVTKNIPPCEIWAGNPARKIGYVE